MASRVDGIPFKESVPDWNASGTSEPKEMILITQSLKELQLLFHYLFDKREENNNYTSEFTFSVMKEPEGNFTLPGLSGKYCTYFHFFHLF